MEKAVLIAKKGKGIYDSAVLKARVEKLKLELIKTKKSSFLKSYKIITEMYELQLLIYPKYTYRDLAMDVDMNEGTLYNMMAYRHASKYTQQMLKEGNILPSKVCRVLVSRLKDKQDEVIKKAIDDKYTYDELDRYLADEGGLFTKVAEKRSIKNNWNIARDLLSYSRRFAIVLPNIDKISEDQKEKVIKMLTKTRDSIDVALGEIA